MDEVKVKEHLMQTDETFRKLAEQHQEYERQLEELLQKPYLSDQDQFQEAIIKKKKLAIKDQMQLRIQHYRTQHLAH